MESSKKQSKSSSRKAKGCFKHRIPKRKRVLAFMCVLCGKQSRPIPEFRKAGCPFVSCGNCLAEYPAVYALEPTYEDSLFDFVGSANDIQWSQKTEGDVWRASEGFVTPKP